MISPARRHFQRMTAASAAADAGPGPMAGDQYQLMLAALIEDRRRLKDIQSIERKIEVKRELLPKYQPYIQGVLEAGRGAEDEVLTTVMVWLIDVGHLEAALRIAEYVLTHALPLPDRYQRSAAALIAEEIATEALRQLQTDAGTAESLLSPLLQVEALTQGADMHDQIRAKLHKALGYGLRATGEASGAVEQFQVALDHLKRAVELDDRVGVKKDIERLERAIKNAAEPGDG